MEGEVAQLRNPVVEADLLLEDDRGAAHEVHRHADGEGQVQRRIGELDDVQDSTDGVREGRVGGRLAGVRADELPVDVLLPVRDGHVVTVRREDVQRPSVELPEGLDVLHAPDVEGRDGTLRIVDVQVVGRALDVAEAVDERLDLREGHVAVAGRREHRDGSGHLDGVGGRIVQEHVRPDVRPVHVEEPGRGQRVSGDDLGVVDVQRQEARVELSGLRLVDVDGVQVVHALEVDGLQARLCVDGKARQGGREVDGRQGLRRRQAHDGEPAAAHVDALQAGALGDVQLAGGRQQAPDGQLLDVARRDRHGVRGRQHGVCAVRVEPEPLQHLARDGQALARVHGDVHVADVQEIVDALDEHRGVARDDERLVGERLAGLDAHSSGRGRRHVRGTGSDAGIHPLARGEDEGERAGRTTEREGARGVCTGRELAVFAPGADVHEAVLQPVILAPILGAAGLRHRVGVVLVPAFRLVYLGLHVHQARDLVVCDLREVLLRLQDAGREVAEGGPAQGRHAGEHVVHHRRALRLEGGLQEVVQTVVLALPEVVAGGVGVVQLDIVGLAVLADVVCL